MKNSEIWAKKFFATMGFAGYAPKAPGTVGSLLTVAVIFYFRDFLAPFFTPENAVIFWFAYLALFSFSVWAANGAQEVFGESDPSKVVIDEMCGQLITFFLIPLSWKTLLLGFVLFRFFDIVKPYPVHRFEELDDGLGIVMDDVAAGVLANISLTAIMLLYAYIKTFI